LPKGAKVASNDVVVNVHNYGNDQVKVEQNQNPAGLKEVFVIIADNIANRGPVGRAIESTYGLKRPGRGI